MVCHTGPHGTGGAIDGRSRRRYQVQEYFDRIFTPYSVKMKKYLGEWHLCREPLFPGYVFVISSQPEELYQALKRIPRLTRLLGTGENWTPMSQEDIDTVHRLAGPIRQSGMAHRLLRGHVQNGTINHNRRPPQRPRTPNPQNRPPQTHRVAGSGADGGEERGEGGGGDCNKRVKREEV